MWVWTSVLILTERSTVSAERALAMEVGPGGLDLTPFARLVYRHPDGEVHFVQLNVMLAHRQLPSHVLRWMMEHALVYRRCS